MKLNNQEKKEIGVRLRYIRELLKITLDDMGKQAGISRRFISEYEKGLRCPPLTYLKYLHDVHNINLNYILRSEGRMFRLTETDKNSIEFGDATEDVDELLLYMLKVPHCLYSVLGFFTEYKLTNKEVIRRDFPGGFCDNKTIYREK